MTAYNLPHVSLNERRNKGNPIHAKCHNLEPSGCITSVSLLRLLMPRWSAPVLTWPTARGGRAVSEMRSCLFEFISANKTYHRSSQRTSCQGFFFYILLHPPFIQSAEKEKGKQESLPQSFSFFFLLFFFFYNSYCVFIAVPLSLSLLIFFMHCPRGIFFCFTGVQLQQLWCAPGVARG